MDSSTLRVHSTELPSTCNWVRQDGIIFFQRLRDRMNFAYLESLNLYTLMTPKQEQKLLNGEVVMSVLSLNMTELMVYY